MIVLENRTTSVPVSTLVFSRLRSDVIDQVFKILVLCVRLASRHVTKHKYGPI